MCIHSSASAVQKSTVNCLFFYYSALFMYCYAQAMCCTLDLKPTTYVKMESASWMNWWDEMEWDSSFNVLYYYYYFVKNEAFIHYIIRLRTSIRICMVNGFHTKVRDFSNGERYPNHIGNCIAKCEAWPQKQSRPQFRSEPSIKIFIFF